MDLSPPPLFSRSGLSHRHRVRLSNEGVESRGGSTGTFDRPDPLQHAGDREHAEPLLPKPPQPPAAGTDLDLRQALKLRPRRSLIGYSKCKTPVDSSGPHESGSLCYNTTGVNYTVFLCVVRPCGVSLTTGSLIMISTEKVSLLTSITSVSPSVCPLRQRRRRRPFCFLCVMYFLCRVCCSVLIQLVREKSRHALQENLHLIKTPALVIWGKEDKVLMSNSDAVMVV